MKPELSNLFTVTSTGVNNDIVLSFYYEWKETFDGKTMDLRKEKTASVVLANDDVKQLSDVLVNVIKQIEKGRSNNE